MTKEELTVIFRNRGKAYRHKTTDYFIKDDKNGKCTIYIQESQSIRKDPKDWIRNFNITPVKDRIEGHTVYVHRGFHEAFQELVEVLYPQIHRYKEIAIVGYSHGASVGLRTYFYIKQVLPAVKVNPPVLFGCPSLFSFMDIKGFLTIKKLCRPVITVRLGNDIVSRIPFWFMGYGRVGKELKFKIDRKRQNPAQWFKSLFLDHGKYYNYFT